MVYDCKRLWRLWSIIWTCSVNLRREWAGVTKLCLECLSWRTCLGLYMSLNHFHRSQRATCESHHINDITALEEEMSQAQQICCVGNSHGKPAWDCIWVALTKFRSHRGQLCEFHHINRVTTITREGDELGSPNSVCRHLSWNCHHNVVCLSTCPSYHDNLRMEWVRFTKFNI